MTSGSGLRRNICCGYTWHYRLSYNDSSCVSTAVVNTGEHTDKDNDTDDNDSCK